MDSSLNLFGCVCGWVGGVGVGGKLLWPLRSGSHCQFCVSCCIEVPFRLFWGGRRGRGRDRWNAHGNAHIQKSTGVLGVVQFGSPAVSRSLPMGCVSSSTLGLPFCLSVSLCLSLSLSLSLSVSLCLCLCLSLYLSLPLSLSFSFALSFSFFSLSLFFSPHRLSMFCAVRRWF